MTKTLNDKCKLCGCEREYHEEGLGYCHNCNPIATTQYGCSSFRETGNKQILKKYKERKKEQI